MPFCPSNKLTFNLQMISHPLSSQHVVSPRSAVFCNWLSIQQAAQMAFDRLCGLVSCHTTIHLLHYYRVFYYYISRFIASTFTSCSSDRFG